MKNTINLEMSTELKSSSVKPLGLKIMSRDININEFMLKFKDSKGDDLKLDSTYKVEVLSVFTKSKTESLTPASILGTFAFWSFDTSLITQEESVFNYVYVSKNGVPIVSADANGFWFNVGLSKVDEGTRELATSYDYNYEKVLHEFEARVTMSVEEIEAVAVNESQRQANEQVRNTNEANRIADENIRKANEIQRNDKQIRLKNEVINGNFSNGLNNWVIDSGAQVDILENEVRITSTKNSLQLYQTLSPSLGDIMYFGCHVKTDDYTNFGMSTNQDVTLLQNKTGYQYLSTSNKRTNHNVFSINAYSIIDGTTKVAYVRGAVAINLTKAFGAGNEPTKEQMDELLAITGHISGERVVSHQETFKLIGARAKTKQEDWITPTLVNGATGDVQFRKNEFGRVEFKGNLKGVEGQESFVLPVGYRPPATVRLIVATNLDSNELGIVRVLMVAPSGDIFSFRPYDGSTTTYDLSSASFATV